MFPSFHDAYLAVLKAVTEHPTGKISTRGNTSLELLDVSFRIADPRDRLPYFGRRPINLPYNWGELLWFLAGRDDLEMISYYAPRIRAHSGDGIRLAGTAYGRPLFQPGGDSRSQWDRVLDLLAHDPDSKRAVISIFGSDELAADPNPDVSCTIAAQFLLREGALHLSVYMRGNDAYRGMVSDVFAFTVLQELAALRLGARLGHYSHHVGSMHVNAPDLGAVEHLIEEATAPGRRPPVSKPPTMPVTTAADITFVLLAEESLRTNAARHTPASVAETGLPRYWQQVLLVLEAFRQIKHTIGEVGASVLAALDPGYRWHLERRWPSRMPQAAS
ncbi:thymidylate synthase [Sinosporangium album]|uniref:thymidylate synthase n=1 Tax=Sinosporangium album TaxID=504805 RepID=UPI001FE09403|nr:thymidylate synthase [Sinosporangium album]